MEGATFSTIDYILLCLMMILSLGIGLFSAVFKKQNSAKEYLHGGKNMNFIAVSLSLVSSLISGVSLISFPTDVYYYGGQYLLMILSVIMVGVTAYYLILPIFYKLELTSIYKYLELRFDSKVKLFSSFLYAVQMIIYSPLVVYAPALIVSQVTNISVHFITPIICVICIIYTVFGGIKAVIWTDALQTLIMFGCMIALLVIGVIEVGGIENVYNINYNTGRLFFNFDIDPTERDTFWSVLIGTYAFTLGVYAFGQGTIQKYLSLSSYKSVTDTNIMATVGLVFIFFLCFFCGFVTVAKYVYCDPKSISKIQKPDEIIPYFIMDVGKSYPGLAGIFVAGVISAGLSTLSAILNSLAATIYNDLLKSFLPKKVDLKYETTILKLIAAIFGVVCVSLAYVIEQLGTSLLPLFIALVSLTNGPMMGLFLVGMLVPKVNSNGALIGGVTSMLLLGWLIITAQSYKTKGMIKYPELPVFTNDCLKYPNITYKPSPDNITTLFDVPSVYKISHYYFPVIGIILVALISLPVSYIWKDEKHSVHEDYLSPVVANYVKRKRLQRSPTYSSVSKEIPTEPEDLKD